MIPLADPPRVHRRAVSPVSLPGMVAAALVLALPGTAPASAQFFSAESDSSVISVTAMGEASVAPDRMVLFASFYGNAGSGEDAVVAAAAERERAVASLRDLGVSEADIVVSGAAYGAAMDPRRGPPGPGAPESWDGAYGLRITVRPLDRLDAVLGALARAGMDQVSYSQVEAPEHLEEAMRLAARRAVEQARVQAEALAEAAGVRLGALVRIITLPDYSAINDNIRQFGGFPDRGARLAHDDVIVRTTVNVVWGIRR